MEKLATKNIPFPVVNTTQTLNICSKDLNINYHERQRYDSENLRVSHTNTPAGQEAKNLQVLLLFMSFIKKNIYKGHNFSNQPAK